MPEIQCYNKGCGAKFDPEDNKEDSCCYHPGAPVFHDAYKGWSCCNKKSIDFTTFLSMKGCATGQHNPEKPCEPAIVEKKELAFEESVQHVMPTSILPPLERPDFNSTLLRLSTTISQSLKLELEKLQIPTIEEPKDVVETGVRFGESCKNNGCKATYDEDNDSLEVCKHHPGYPVFHEGCKYWSCCRKLTSDFDVFLDQVGCTSGMHLWKKKDVKTVTCRYDWHQTCGFVYLTIYAKVSQPDLSYVDMNPIRILCHIIFGGDSAFNIDLELDEVITPSECTVSMSATKVEIKMKKANGKTWVQLNKDIKKPDLVESSTKEEDEKKDEKIDLSSIDLSDL